MNRVRAHFGYDVGPQHLINTIVNHGGIVESYHRSFVNHQEVIFFVEPDDEQSLLEQLKPKFISHTIGG